MSTENLITKFRLTEKAISKLSDAGMNPRSYVADLSGLALRNLGDEVKILGRNKYVAFEEKLVLVSTGIQLVLPAGAIGLIQSTPDLLRTSLVLRTVPIGPDYTGEVFINFLNMGENDVVIPVGAILPVKLIVASCHYSFKIVSDLEYLDETRAASDLVGDPNLSTDSEE